MTRIAIIEDEPIDSDNIKKLVEESLGAEVKQAFNKADAEALLSLLAQPCFGECCYTP